MAIKFKCSSCGQGYSVPEQSAGKTAKCKNCGNPVVIPAAPPATPSAPPPPQPAEAQPVQPQPGAADDRSAMEKTFENVAAMAAGGAAGASSGAANPAAPAASGQGHLRKMKCVECGGNVKFKVNQGNFQCKFCGREYEATTNAEGKAVVRVIAELKKSVDNVDNELRAKRLQEKAAAVQDQLDSEYVEFFHSLPRKAGSAAFILWIIGAIMLLAGTEHGFSMIIVGLVLIGAGVGAFMWFKQANKAYQAQAEQMENEKLKPIHDQLRKIGAVLEGGNVSLGYIEKTSTPQRYCVNCRQNVTPDKGKGGGGSLTGVNFFLTVITCGAWLPAWILIGILTKGGSAASRAVAKGKCPMCAGTPLFPARIANV